MVVLSGCEQYPRIPHSGLEDGFCAFEYPIEVDKPRMVHSLEGTSDVLILERNTESVVLLHDTNDDGVPDSKRTILTQVGLNHGLELHDGYIYASSDEIVFRWKYSHSSSENSTVLFDTVDASPTYVVDKIDKDGSGGAPQGHTTRTLIFDSDGKLYVSVGSASNVDDDSYRSRIRRFDVSDSAKYPIDFATGEVFVDGVRNEVGLAFDRHDVLWGVENGADQLQRDDLGTDIYNDNPAEELNRFPEANAGSHFGYPYCWTEYSLPTTTGKGRGSQWAWPNTFATDEMCQSLRYQKSALAMQAHSAPLGIVFYHWNDTPKSSQMQCGGLGGGAFPQSMDGYAFIAFHGSWNRDIPTGYKVVYVPIDSTGNVADEAKPVDLLYHKGDGAKWDSGFRPVDLDFDECGRLVLTSDGTRGEGSSVVRIEYGTSGAQSSASMLDPPGMLLLWSVWIGWILSRWR